MSRHPLLPDVDSSSACCFPFTRSFLVFFSCFFKCLEKAMRKVCIFPLSVTLLWTFSYGLLLTVYWILSKYRYHILLFSFCLYLHSSVLSVSKLFSILRLEYETRNRFLLVTFITNEGTVFNLSFFHKNNYVHCQHSSRLRTFSFLNSFILLNHKLSFSIYRYDRKIYCLF